MKYSGKFQKLFLCLVSAKYERWRQRYIRPLQHKMAKMLGNDYDIEILETRHRFKKDSPRGTAFGPRRRENLRGNE